MHTRQPSPRKPRARQWAACLCLGLVAAFAHAQGQHHHGEPPPGTMQAAPARQALRVFVASTAKPFAALMDDAMVVMDEGMQRAPMNGQADHDFITMMIPHHQGAADMAKAVLLYTDDPEIRNIALGIIADQENEIRVMEAWLQHHPAKPLH